MNIDTHYVKDFKIREKKFEHFTCFEITISGDDEIHLFLYEDKPDGEKIKWFKELDEIIVDLEAHPDSLQDSIERLKALVPLEV